MNKSIGILLIVLLTAFAVSAQTTEFTYQGSLKDGANSANGNYDFEFVLFDAVSGGAQLGSTLTRNGVAVTNGIFSVSLDFGSQFPGAGRFLEIHVKLAGGGAFTPLTPRHPVTSSPYSIKSVNSDLLGGQPASAFGTSAQIAALQAQNTTLQAQITQLQADLAATTGGTHLWSKGLGSTGEERGYSIAVDGSGNVFVAGYFAGAVNFGGGLLTSAGVADIFVAKYSGATGSHLWSKRFGGTSIDIVQGVAVDGSGNVFLNGYFASSTITFGGSTLTNAGSNDIFLVKLSGNGAHIWSRRFGSTGDDIDYGVAVAPNGDVYITGSFNGTVDFGGLPLTSAGGSNDIFVAKYSGTTSTHIWSKNFGGTSSDVGQAVATDSSGNVFVTGFYASASINFGCAPSSTRLCKVRFS